MKYSFPVLTAVKNVIQSVRESPRTHPLAASSSKFSSKSKSSYSDFKVIDETFDFEDLYKLIDDDNKTNEKKNNQVTNKNTNKVNEDFYDNNNNNSNKSNINIKTTPSTPYIPPIAHKSIIDSSKTTSIETETKNSKRGIVKKSLSNLNFATVILKAINKKGSSKDLISNDDKGNKSNNNNNDFDIFLKSNTANIFNLHVEPMIESKIKTIPSPGSIDCIWKKSLENLANNAISNNSLNICLEVFPNDLIELEHVVKKIISDSATFPGYTSICLQAIFIDNQFDTAQDVVSHAKECLNSIVSSFFSVCPPVTADTDREIVRVIINTIERHVLRINECDMYHKLFEACRILSQVDDNKIFSLILDIVDNRKKGMDLYEAVSSLIGNTNSRRNSQDLIDKDINNVSFTSNNRNSDFYNDGDDNGINVNNDINNIAKSESIMQIINLCVKSDIDYNTHKNNNFIELDNVYEIDNDEIIVEIDSNILVEEDTYIETKYEDDNIIPIHITNEKDSMKHITSFTSIDDNIDISSNVTHILQDTNPLSLNYPIKETPNFRLDDSSPLIISQQSAPPATHDSSNDSRILSFESSPKEYNTLLMYNSDEAIDNKINLVIEANHSNSSIVSTNGTSEEFVYSPDVALNNLTNVVTGPDKLCCLVDALKIIASSSVNSNSTVQIQDMTVDAESLVLRMREAILRNINSKFCTAWYAECTYINAMIQDDEWMLGEEGYAFVTLQQTLHSLTSN